MFRNPSKILCNFCCELLIFSHVLLRDFLVLPDYVLALNKWKFWNILNFSVSTYYSAIKTFSKIYKRFSCRVWLFHQLVGNAISIFSLSIVFMKEMSISLRYRATVPKQWTKQWGVSDCHTRVFCEFTYSEKPHLKLC